MCDSGELDDNGNCDNCPASNETSRNATLALASLLVDEGTFDNEWDAQHDILINSWMNNEKYAKRLRQEEKRIMFGYHAQKSNPPE